MSDQEHHLTQRDNDHIDKRFDEVMSELAKINSAFARNPDGSVDHAGHRQYHETMIQAAEAQTQFWRELRLDIAKKGVWGLLIIICGLVLVGLSAKLGISSK
jgi:hypothetical protein